MPSIDSYTEATSLDGDERIYLQDDPSGTPVDRWARAALVRGPELWLPPNVFQLLSGSPLVSNNNGFAAWLLDGAAAEAIVTNVLFPKGWNTYALDIWWSCVSGSGNVVWRHDYENAGDTISITSASTVGTPSTIAAPSAGTLKVSTLESGLAVGAGRFHSVQVTRLGNDAADTLNAIDATLFGVNLRRIS